MKIYKKIVYDKYDNIIEEDSYEYHGQVTQAGGGGSKFLKAVVVVAAVVAVAVVLGPQVGTIFKGANMNSFFMKALVSVGTSIIGGVIGQKLAPKIDPPNFQTNLDTGVTTSAKAPTQPYRIIYGETRVGGTIVFAETTSSTNEFLHIVYVMAGHEVDTIDEIYLNDDEVSLETTSNDANGIPIYTPTSSDQYAGKLQIKKHLGNDDQVADATLVAALSNWTTNHRIQGKAYIYARFSFDSDVYPNGVPNLSAIIKGKKCFDPRATSFTASSGNVSTTNNTITISSHGLSTHDRAKYDVNGNTAIGGLTDGTTYYVIKVDANTIKLATNFTNCQAGTAINLSSVTGSTTQKFNFTTHTSNPVLCTRDYLQDTKYGMQTSDEEINDTNFIASANICDETVTLDSGTETRFTCNGSFTLAQTPKVIIENLMTTCGGYLIYTNGAFKLIPSTYLTPTVTLTEKNLRSGIAINTRVSKKELFNAVKGLYSEPSNDYQPQNYPILTNSSFESEDNNERIYAEFDYPFTNSSKMCQRLSKIQLLKNRQQISFSSSFDMGAFDCQVGDTVNITNSRMGWSNKTYQVIDWGFDLSGDDGSLQITAQFKETASAVYDFATSDYSTVSSGKATNLPKATQVSPPQAISLSDELVEYNDGTVIVKLVIDITAATDNFTELYEVEIKQTKDANGNAVTNDYVNIGRAARTKFEFLNVIDKASYQVRVRGVNIYGVFSASLESSEHEVVGLTAPPADVENLSINIVGKDAFLNWTAVADLDLAYYELRYQNVTAGAQWQNSVPLVLKVARPATSVSVAAKTGAYLIKARDKLNNPSVNATVVYTSVTSIGNFNAVATSTQNPDFDGAKTDVVKIFKEDGTSALVLDTVELFDSGVGNFDSITTHNFDGGTLNKNVDTEGFYEFDAPIDIGSSFKANITGGITQSVISRDRLFDNVSGNFDVQTGLFDGDAESNCSAELQVATSADGVTYTSFTTFVVGDYSARFFKFRIRMTSTNGSATPEITAASVTIDMEDRIQSENNIVSGASAKTVTYPVAFKQAPALAFAIDNMASGDKYDVTSKTATGFVITFQNSGGTTVSRTFDYIAKGF